MKMQDLYESFPDIARKETKCVTFLNEENGFPLGEYGFCEMFCTDPKCDCRFVMIRVSGPNFEYYGSIKYGWEDLEFYTKWEFGDKDRAKEHVGSQLYPLAPQTQYSEKFLEVFQEIMKNDPSYGERIKRHYFMVKEKQNKKTNIILFNTRKRIGENSPCPCGSKKKYKRCCNLQ